MPQLESPGRQAFGTQRPVYGLYLDETPQIIVYRRGAR
jgi:hypothetical protein